MGEDIRSWTRWKWRVTRSFIGAYACLAHTVYRARLFNVDIRQIPANGLSRSRIHVSIAAARRSSVHDDL